MKKTKLKKSRQSSKVKKSSNSASNLILGLVFILAISYFAYTSIPRQTAIPIDINEVGIASGATVSLSLPPTITSNLNTQTSADILINTGSSDLTAVQVELNYNPSELTITKINQGDFFPVQLGEPKIQNGKITFTYAVKLGEKGKNGSGTLATIVFKPLKDSAQIVFGKSTMAAAFGKNTNMLSSATGTTITTGNADVPPPVNPPFLEDIQPAPKPNVTKPTMQNAQTKPSNPSTTNTATTNNANARTFNESGNFDYSKDAAPSETDTLEITTSKETDLSRFMAFVRSIFGGNK